MIVDSLGSPATGIDLATFDQVFGLAAAPSLDIYPPEGKVTCHCTHVQAGWIFRGKNAQTELGLAYESPLDVGWGHAMAPRGPHQPGGGHLGSSPSACIRSAKNHILYAGVCHGTTPGNNSFAGITRYSAAPGWNAATRPGTPGAAGPADALTHTTP